MHATDYLHSEQRALEAHPLVIRLRSSAWLSGFRWGSAAGFLAVLAVLFAVSL